MASKQMMVKMDQRLEDDKEEFEGEGEYGYFPEVGVDFKAPDTPFVFTMCQGEDGTTSDALKSACTSLYCHCCLSCHCCMLSLLVEGASYYCWFLVTPLYYWLNVG